jgi:CO/xanthine dehydrogenase Mo-binding subunit
MEKVAEAIGWTSKYHAPGQKTLADGRLHGIGIWAHADGHVGASGTRGMIINMNEDGTVLFNSGAARNMGGPSAQAAFIAEVIGVTYDAVRCGEWGDPDTSSEGGNQGGSTLTVSIGSACIQAAEDVRNQLFTVAAGSGSGMLKTTVDALDAKDGKIFLKADPTKFVTHGTVMAAIAQPVIGKGVMRNPSLRKPVGTFPVGNSGVHRTGTASAAEVAVDTETGLVEVINFASAVDCGRVIDRNSSEGQVSGGLQVDVNQSFFYTDIYDPLTGILLSYGYIHDKIATMMDYDPAINQIYLLETIDASGPFGCHGIGEPAVGTFASIINAVNNALNVWVTEYPMTPQVILTALGKV